jgi:hypothetical protein
VEAPTTNVVEALARLSLFADVPHPQHEAIAQSFAEEVFPILTSIAFRGDTLWGASCDDHTPVRRV